MNKKEQELGWWIEILTYKPMYIYYFGVFESYWEAERSKNGYIQDLHQEKAEIVRIKIKYCQPQDLTVYVNQRKGWKSKTPIITPIITGIVSLIIPLILALIGNYDAQNKEHEQIQINCSN